MPIGNTVYFYATGGSPANLWQSNGTPDGTVLLPSNVFPESPGLSTLWVTSNQQLLASSNGPNTTLGSELWKATLQPGGSALVMDINTVTPGSSPNYLTVAGNLAFFSANDGVNGETLWKTDGSSTTRVPLSL